MALSRSSTRHSFSLRWNSAHPQFIPLVASWILIISVSAASELSGHTSSLLQSVPLPPKSLGTKGEELLLKRDTRKSTIACPIRDLEIETECPRNCTLDSHCSKKDGEKCLCFRECGLSCINKQTAYCHHPGLIENGKVVYVGPTGLYELRFLKQTVPSKGHILYECDHGFAPVDGPPGKTCENGIWQPVGTPKCTDTESPGFHWFRTGRLKRRAIKTGGSSSIVRSKTGPGGGSGGLGTRRTKKKGNRFGEEEDNDFAPIICPNLDHDPYIQTEVIQPGEEQNETFSAGAIVKVSCKPGFGVNLPNETVRCDKGKWRPKIPQCSALPCKTPYIVHGVFYEGAKPLYFQELKKHKTIADVKCLKGYKLKGPSKLHCWFGEWDVAEAPECLPAPCKLPNIEAGSYLNTYEVGKHVQHGIEVDYVCSGSYRKLIPGPVRCDLGEWKQNVPYCVHPSVSSADVYESGGGKKGGGKKGMILQPSVKKGCTSPPKHKGAYTYVNGLPLEWDVQFSFEDATEVLYRCSTLKAKSKNRWKLTCEDEKWVGSTNLTCDGDAPIDKWMSLPIMSMVNGSCTYKRTDKHVVTFFDDQVIIEDSKEFPHGTILTSRCVDIGKFQLQGAVRRKCLSAQWMGLTPKCEGLSQYQDYALDKPPTILFRYTNGSIVQDTVGNLVAYPGTILHMECLWIRKFGKPTWSTSIANKTYPEGWADVATRDSQLEYRLTINNAQKRDEGRYSCKTPARHTHEINLLVKEATCPPLPEHSDLIYSTNDTILGTRVTFTCRLNNSLIGAEELFCSASGKWSASLPKCENVECLDIALVPAMAPLAVSYLTKNGTLKRNETAPPKVMVYGTHVGGKATFTCDQGYMVEGAADAECQPNGEWSASMPLCVEVECRRPPVPENGMLVGQIPEKFKAGDFANFECKQGYMMEGQPMLACQDNGKWSKATGIKCKIGCPYPGTIILGSLSSSSQIKFYYDIGETVEFECQGGYDLQGTKRLICLKNGKWSQPVPTCGHSNYDHLSNP